MAYLRALLFALSTYAPTTKRDLGLAVGVVLLLGGLAWYSLPLALVLVGGIAIYLSRK